MLEKRDFPGGPVIRTLLSLLRALVHSLVGELRSYEPKGGQNKKMLEKSPSCKPASHSIGVRGSTLIETAHPGQAPQSSQRHKESDTT